MSHPKKKLVSISLAATVVCALALCLPDGVSRSVAGDTPLTFDKVVEYLELDVKEDRILKALENSSTVFTLGDDQVRVLKSKGASDRLIEAIRQKVQSPNQQLGSAASDISDFVLILDCSGSMRAVTADGKTKFDAARQAALDLIAAVPDGKQLAFVAYGHDKNRGCSAVDVLWQLAPLNDKGRASLTEIVNGLEPVGNTPIATALKKANEQIEGSSGLSKLILITDGMETCGGDPVAVARTLAANAHLKGGVNVIGFDLNKREAKAVAQIAEAGKGKYYNAKNATELVKTAQVVGRTIAQAEEPEPVKPKYNLVKLNVTPSKDPTSPAAIELGKYVSGRIPTDVTHYFSLNLPAGDYVAVVDGKPSNGGAGSMHYACSVDATEIFSQRGYRVSRAANKFRVEEGSHIFSIWNDRITGILMDYNFAVYRATDEIPPPFIKYSASHEFIPYEIGTTVKYTLKAVDLTTRQNYYRTHLEVGDYLMTVTTAGFGDGSTIATGIGIAETNVYGAAVKGLGGTITHGGYDTINVKLLISDAQDFFFLVGVKDDDDNLGARGTLTIKKVGAGSEAK